MDCMMGMDEWVNKNIIKAAQLIEQADRIIVLAGAGMGVDSGLPDFRGSEGMWRAYPMLKGVRFEELANHILFVNNPETAWGFYGHRLNMYRATQPHDGFHILKTWLDAKPRLGYVFTSNVDGHFAKAGFDLDRLYEIHGNIHWLQCTRIDCKEPMRPMDRDVAVDERLKGEPVQCACGAPARPNILLFNDGYFDWTRTEVQMDAYIDFKDQADLSNTVLIELGAGDAIPSVMGETAFLSQRALGVIEINPGRTLRANGDRWVGLPLGAQEALTAINEALLKSAA